MFNYLTHQLTMFLNNFELFILIFIENTEQIKK